MSNLTCHWISLLLHTNPFGIEFLWQWGTLSLTPPTASESQFPGQMPKAVTATTNETKDTSIKPSWVIFFPSLVIGLCNCYNKRKVTNAFLRVQIEIRSQMMYLSVYTCVFNLIEKCYVNFC